MQNFGAIKYIIEGLTKPGRKKPGINPLERLWASPMMGKVIQRGHQKLMQK